MSLNYWGQVMLQSHRLDGFDVFTGLMAVIAGPIILVTGTLAPGWSVLITVAGVIVLWAQWKVVKGDRNEDARADPVGRDAR